MRLAGGGCLDVEGATMESIEAWQAVAVHWVRRKVASRSGDWAQGECEKAYGVASHRADRGHRSPPLPLDSQPTPLNALLLALLHTILSLDVTGDSVVHPLRATVQGHGNGCISFTAWTNWVYSGCVKERKVKWQREQEEKTDPSCLLATMATN